MTVGLAAMLVGLACAGCTKGDYVDRIEVGNETGTDDPLALNAAYPLRFYRSRDVPTPKNTLVEKEEVTVDSASCSAPCSVSVESDGTRVVASNTKGTFDLHVTGRGVSSGELYDLHHALTFVDGARAQLDVLQGLPLSGRNVAPGRLRDAKLRWVDANGNAVRLPYADSAKVRAAVGSCTWVDDSLTFESPGACAINAGLPEPTELRVVDVKYAVGLVIMQARKGSDFRCTPANSLLVGYTFADGSRVAGGAEYWVDETTARLETNPYVISFFFPDRGGVLRAEHGSFRESVAVRSCTQ